MFDISREHLQKVHTQDEFMNRRDDGKRVYRVSVVEM